MQLIYDNENERSRFLQGQVNWANDQLSKENVCFPSGRMSHDCAYEVLDQYQDELIDHLVLIP